MISKFFSILTIISLIVVTTVPTAMAQDSADPAADSNHRLFLPLINQSGTPAEISEADTPASTTSQATPDSEADSNNKSFLPWISQSRVAVENSDDETQVSVALVQRWDRRLPDSVVALKLSSPIEASGLDVNTLVRGVDVNAIAGGLRSTEGKVTVIIRLKADSVAEAKGKGQVLGLTKQGIVQQQQGFLGRALALDPNVRVIARVQLVLNAVFVEVARAALPTLANDPEVLQIVPIGTYRLALSETVPYIGARSVQDTGYDGAGVRVAVLDTGIDYYHAALDGSGNPADYAADDPTVIEPGAFPTQKVIGGYDFVGNAWPFAPLAPDPDPLDDGPKVGHFGNAGGHGTYIAHIIGGNVEDRAHGIYKGVAPGVELYAVKVCSSVTLDCSGIALIQGLEFAVDPNGDGDPADHVDIVNMSLGDEYGQAFDDALSLAVDNATALGVLTVAASGNSSDMPYITSTPAAANTALSVAQTATPRDFLQSIEVKQPAAIAGFYDALFQPWSAPLLAPIEAPVIYGDGEGGNLDGCAPFEASLAGKIVLVDVAAWDCYLTLKISNISQAGGLIGIVGVPYALNTYGDNGDRPIDIPGYLITQADADILKRELPGTVVRFDPTVGLSLVKTVVPSSSRGPRNPDSLMKPEIGAPGGSVSALAGSGTDTGPFSGTSGATPMVVGAAALLLQTQPGLSPAEVKARLMNNGETDIRNEVSGPLAPISRIGGGEVRVDRAITAPAAAWDEKRATGALSFGFVDVAKNVVHLERRVRVRNYSHRDIEYTVTPIFRYEDDVTNGAVTLDAPRKVKVKAGKDATFTVKLTINGALLRGNFMNSGSMGANPSGLTLNEYDGYLIFDDGQHPIHLAWHVLPRKAANLVTHTQLTFKRGLDVVKLTNQGVGVAQNDAYTLLALSPNLPEGDRGEESPTPDIRGVGVNTFPVEAGFCSDQKSFVWAFAINTWERQSYLAPVVHEVVLDTNRDGIWDYYVMNGESFDGGQKTWVFDMSTDWASAWFYAEHSTNTGNTVLYVCGEQVGLTGTDMLKTNVDMIVATFNGYYLNPPDLVEGLTVTPLGERYYTIPEDVVGKAKGKLTVTDFGPFPGNSPELGVMLFANGDRGDGNRGGAAQDSEALFLMAP